MTIINCEEMLAYKRLYIITMSSLYDVKYHSLLSWSDYQISGVNWTRSTCNNPVERSASISSLWWRETLQFFFWDDYCSFLQGLWILLASAVEDLSFESWLRLQTLDPLLGDPCGVFQFDISFLLCNLYFPRIDCCSNTLGYYSIFQVLCLLVGKMRITLCRYKLFLV